MHYTLEAMLNGSDKILGYYEAAKGKWPDLFDRKHADQAAWVEWLHENVGFFEKECGGNLVGHEVMAWSAFASLYSTQFRWRDAQKALAEKLVEAVKASSLAEDIKDAAAKAALSYDLEGKVKVE